jgi:hypothetical protein
MAELKESQGRHRLVIRVRKECYKQTNERTTNKNDNKYGEKNT